MELQHFKTALAKFLIEAYNSLCRNTLITHTSYLEVIPASVPFRLSVLQTTVGKYKHCYNYGIENKTYMQCNTCGVFFC